MTAERYFEVCEQMGTEPDPDRIPVHWDDLPDIVQEALNCFNSLGDRLVPDIGYLGKDYTAAPLYMESYDQEQKELFLQTLTWLDERAITKSAERMKQERAKLKRR